MIRTLSKILMFFIILQGCTFYAAQARVYLDFTSPNFRKVPTAVPYFIDKARPDRIEELGRKLADLLAKGLEFHGFISVLPAQSYGGRQDVDWKALGADLAISGRYSLSENDITLEIAMTDVLEGRTVFGRRYSGPKEKYDKMVLKFCDDVIEQLTGEPGICQSKIAFVSDYTGYKEIYVADALGEDVRQVTRHRRLAVAPRFSPDGNRLAYTSYHSGNPNLYITDLTQDRFTRAISRRSGLNLAPAWAADGKTMVLTLSKDGNPDLYLMNTTGDILRKLTSNTGVNVSPAWSPDRRHLAFVSDRSGTPQIYIMDIRNGRTNRITFSGSDNSQPVWSPKGDWIAYTGLYEGNYHIFIIKPEGGSPIKVTQTPGDHESPSWSPDGQQLIFSRRINDRQILYLIFKNGSGLRPWFYTKGHLGSPQWSGRLTN